VFGDRVLLPDKNRKAPYDSSAPGSGRWFTFACSHCGNQISLDLPSFIGNYQDRESVLGASYAEDIRLHFGLRQDRSLVDGWPKFRIESCSACDTSYLVYVAVHEPANGWFKIIPQGISRLPSNGKG